MCDNKNAPVAAQAPAASIKCDAEFDRFLADVMTAAGLVTHGRRCKALGERLGARCMKYRLQAPSAKLVESVETISPPGSKVVVQQLHLTEEGREMLRTTSTGIQAPAADGDALDAARWRKIVAHWVVLTGVQSVTGLTSPMPGDRTSYERYIDALPDAVQRTSGGDHD